MLQKKLYPNQSTSFKTKVEQFRLCQGYCLLGRICHSKGETEKAINHLKAALGIASSSNWDNELFWILYSLALSFHKEGKFHDAQAHIEHAKSHTVNDPYLLGCAMEQQARFWYREGRLEEAKSEGLCAVGVYEKLGAARNMERCRKLLQRIERRTTNLVTSDRLDSTGKLLEVVLLPTLVNSPCLEHGTG
jgi:tetratricopeptide (TPR) repeat protein